MTVLELKEVIEKGLKKGYWQNLELLSLYTEFVDEVREYLLTVNVAQQLLEWNKSHEYKIRIEYGVLHFYNNAFQSHRWVGDLFNLTLISRQSGHSPTDKNCQKIDIAITKEELGDHASEHERTLVGIELKAINTFDSDIIKDAVRLAKAMVRKDRIGENSIKFGFCGFLNRLDANDLMVNKEFIASKIKDYSSKWNSECEKLNEEFHELNFSFDSFNVVQTLLEDVGERHREMDSDYSEVVNDTGIVVGGIITITRK